MVCTSGWLADYYVLPLTRFFEATIQRAAMLQTTLAPSSMQNAVVVGESMSCQPQSKDFLDDKDAEEEVEESIPLVMAIPVYDQPKSVEVRGTSEFFMVGQLVRTFGLLHEDMNGQLALVEERLNDRIRIRMLCNQSLYSVESENLLIVGDTAEQDR